VIRIAERRYKYVLCLHIVAMQEPGMVFGDPCPVVILKFSSTDVLKTNYAYPWLINVMARLQV
jgi:hypothetical protein